MTQAPIRDEVRVQRLSSGPLSLLRPPSVPRVDGIPLPSLPPRLDGNPDLPCTSARHRPLGRHPRRVSRPGVVLSVFIETNMWWNHRTRIHCTAEKGKRYVRLSDRSFRHPTIYIYVKSGGSDRSYVPSQLLWALVRLFFLRSFSKNELVWISLSLGL
jgi:hypothetical protein